MLYKYETERSVQQPQWDIRKQQFAASLLLLNGIAAQAAPVNVVQPAPGADGGAILRGIEQQLPPLRQSLPIPSPAEPTLAPTTKVQEEMTVTVKGFEFSGQTLVSEQDLHQLLQEYIGQEMTLAEIQKAADKIATLYQERGYLASVSLPAQKIDAGIIKIKIVEGRLGAVKIDSSEGNGRFPSELAQAYVLENNPIGDFLVMRRIERAIYILNETPGVAVSTEIEPGTEDGDVDLKVTLTDTPLFKGQVEANNQSSRATGELQTLVRLFLDNPSGNGDQIGFNGTKSQGSSYARWEYTTPLNRDGLKLGGYLSNLAYHNVGDFGFPVSPNGGYGSAKTAGVNLNHALLRSAETNLNLSLTMDRRQYSNWMSSTNFYTSQYIIHDWTFGLSGNHYDEWGGGGISSGSLTITNGKLDFGADNPNTYGLYSSPKYTKALFNLTRDQQLIPGSVSWIGSLTVQMASGDLDSAEKLYLGGPYGIRAYPLSQAGGSEGSVLTQEIQKKWSDGWVTSAFIDTGRIQQYRSLTTYAQLKGRTGADNVYALSGYGFSVAYATQGMNSSLSVARAMGHNPLLNNYGLPLNNDNRSLPYYAWFKMAFTF
jgi:hemolysin activation/secretion protein